MSKPQNLLVQNKKAFFKYEILSTYEAGVALQGTEVKSLRSHDASLDEAYIRIDQGEVWLIGCYIAPYRHGNIHNHEETRKRKLLLHKKEITDLRRAVEEKGLTIIPIKLLLKKGRVKLSLALARGKKDHDKRKTIKERDEKKTIAQALKHKLS